MKGFSKITFGEGGGTAEAVECTTCGRTACFCLKDLGPTKSRVDGTASSAAAAESTCSNVAEKVPRPKFNWKRAIKQQLKAMPDHQMTLKRLRKGVIRNSGESSESVARKRFHRRLKNLKGVVLESGPQRTIVKLASAVKAAAAAASSQQLPLHVAAPSAATEHSVVSLHSEDDWAMMLQASTEMPVVVDFTASWCGPCKTIAPIFAAMCERTPGALFVKVDVDELEEQAAEARVTAMPTFQIWRNGKSVDVVEGANQRALVAMIERAVGKREAGAADDR